MIPMMSGPPATKPLPPLRRDIEIVPGGPEKSGAPAWIIHDPLQNRYFHITRETYEILSLWKGGTLPADLAAEASRSLDLTVEVADVEKLAAFLERHTLLDTGEAASWTDLALRAQRMHGSLWSRLLHNYLFFKIPLVRPEKTLQRLLPWVEPLYSRTAAFAAIASGLLGLYLTSRQWDQFLGTFHNYTSWEGVIALACTLFFIKGLHELGHAFTAARYGCRVPAMGLAFMVMAPMLYTDVSDAWRIQSRRQRLHIHGAGVVVELALACIATLLWAFLPDGIVRGAAFTVASISWIMSLAVNLNPLMRFDGYYLFAEFIGIDNLQSRSTAFGQWKLRQILFAPGLQPPEPLDRRWQWSLILYAWMSWIYRFFLFLGIAVLVYHFSFKVIGIVLFAVEIWYFITRPVVHEVAEWIKIMPQVASPRRLTISASLAIPALIAAALPLSHHIDVPAIAEADTLIRVYPPRAAKVVSVNVERGAVVKAGMPLVTLELPEIDSEIAATRIRIDLTRLRLGRVADDTNDRQERLVMTHELDTLATRLAGLEKEKQELVVRAPISGKVLELPSGLHAGRWIGKTDLLALVADRQDHTVRGYVNGAYLSRVYDKASGRFIPDDLTRPSFDVALTGVARAGATSIDIPELTSLYGGAVAVTPDENHALVPTVAQYRVELAPVGLGAALDQTIRGVVRLDVARESLVMSLWKQVSKVLVRESGF